jgi:predicted mannosyl-3-phosphoglycerate phosphatase (HAD superfamily)
MTIQQLIENLQQFPPEMRVIVSGYEDGYNDVSIIEEKEIAIDILNEWYYGQHVEASDEFRLEQIENPVIEKAIFLDGKNLNSK